MQVCSSEMTEKGTTKRLEFSQQRALMICEEMSTHVCEKWLNVLFVLSLDCLWLANNILVIKQVIQMK